MEVKNSKLTKTQETILIALSKNMLLPLNDLLVVAQQFLKADISISELANCLKNYNNTIENSNKQQNKDGQQLYKASKNYNMGFVNLNIETLPVLDTDKPQQHIYIAIDMATHWLYFEISEKLDSKNSATFLHNLSKAAPFIITRILTLQNQLFTDATDDNKATGEHPFDQACQKLDIQHLLNSQTSGDSGILVEPDELSTKLKNSKHYDAKLGLNDNLKNYGKIYNEQITQISLDHLTPLQAVKKRQEAKEEVLRTKKPFKLSGVQLLIIWIVWLAITMIFASQAMP
ncbi:MAG: hypothetical protein HQL69_07360 [Magnetococcales bacterium]|nr:hypothetical protein [Magnetococcales bacterium]